MDELWALDPDILHLNHGSFGACPRPVLQCQSSWRERLERDPMSFFIREAEAALDAAREETAAFIGASPAGLAFVPNATTGVNTVLRSLTFEAGDEILVTDHEYNACRNAVDFVGARVVVCPIPFPISGPDEIITSLLDRVTSRTRLALIDHITSPTALVMPVERLVAELRERGVDTLIDGAHGPGMLPLELDTLGAAYYTGNCHKWLCAPKGAGFLYVRADRRDRIRPLAISHGANSPRTDRSRFHLEFDWTGTIDLSPYLCIPEAIRVLGSQLPGGWPALREHNHHLAVRGRRILCEALSLTPPCPEEMLGSMAALILGRPEEGGVYDDPLEKRLYHDWRILIPVIRWPTPRLRLVRISSQLYNRPDQYETLAGVLRQELTRDVPLSRTAESTDRPPAG